MGNQSAILLEATGNYIGFEDSEHHPGVWTKE